MGKPYDMGMNKKEQEPKWVEKLRSSMKAKDLNPRSLSLKAGLNPTAVRDMLEGRVKFPRYDTVESLAGALDLTPAQLMSNGPAPTSQKTNSAALPLDNEDLNLLTEIITRLQETAEEYRHALDPKDFAAMVTTIYRQMKPNETQPKKSARASLTPKIKSLMDYERLRKQVGQK